MGPKCRHSVCAAHFPHSMLTAALQGRSYYTHFTDENENERLLWPSCSLPPSPCSPPISPTQLLTHRLQGDKNQGQELDWSLGRQHTEWGWEG